MPLTTTVLLVLGLLMIQIVLQETSRYRFDLRAIVGNRDHPPALSIIAGRLDRAKDNLLEALPFFLGLALLALTRHGDTALAEQGAMIFLIARIAYVPAYLSGIPLLRSLIWLVANAGLIMMTLAVIWT